MKATVIKESSPSFATSETRQDCYDILTEHFLLELIKMDERHFPSGIWAMADYKGTKTKYTQD